MLPRISAVRYVHGHPIWLSFADGQESEVNPERELEGVVFEPLKDKEYFKAFTLHRKLRSVIWPNGTILRRSSCELRCAFRLERLSGNLIARR